MASITIEDSKTQVYRTDLTDGGIPYAAITDAEDGAQCLAKDQTGKIWRFIIVPNDDKFDLSYYLSTDTVGDDWGDITVIKADVAEGTPGAAILATGRITVNYFGTDDKWYQSVSDDYGATWTESEITTA